jgi:hypothetical protein
MLLGVYGLLETLFVQKLRKFFIPSLLQMEL